MIRTGERASKQFKSLKKHPGAIWIPRPLSLTETGKNLDVTNVVDTGLRAVVGLTHPQVKEMAMTTEVKMREQKFQSEIESGWLDKREVLQGSISHWKSILMVRKRFAKPSRANPSCEFDSRLFLRCFVCGCKMEQFPISTVMWSVENVGRNNN